DLGLIKLDLLSLRTMSAIDDAVASIRRSGADFDYERIPLDDRATYQLISSGQTIGVFQLESPAQRALQARLGASHMEDIVASVAIIRPGPIKGNMVEPYIARRQGKEPVSFLHPKLEAILGKTYGVILFQEQVIEVATAIANFTPGEADGLRRVMTHARSHRAMEEIGEVFVARAVANGVERELAEEIFRCIAGYASYGFCEAHAAAFATTSFKTAYLLRHFPAEFYAAILSNQPMGYYPPYIIGNEARRRGIAILPPHLNLSGEKFEVEGKGIRIPLTRIKGLSRQGVASILARRPFSSLEDLVARTELARDELESLIRCGALDSLDANRRRLLVLLPACLQARQAGPGQGGLDFAPAATAGLELPDFSEAEKRRDEFELLGMDVRGHVMEGFRRRLQAAGFLSSRQLAALPAGGPVRVAGMLFRPHRPPTRSGRVTVFMSLEDEFGLIEVTVFEDVYQRCGHRIFAPQHGPLVVEGMAQRRGNAVGVVARQVWRWQEAFPGGE
ncbi:MAG: error-prone DNA polymerase, partial [Syntrophomonadaceae bacterium]|nr:error-prone DNA polymerase [Syntrophomonadaceae bacterium]